MNIKATLEAVLKTISTGNQFPCTVKMEELKEEGMVQLKVLKEGVHVYTLTLDVAGVSFDEVEKRKEHMRQLAKQQTKRGYEFL